MNDKKWQRARSSKQVKHRENEILEAAEELFRSIGYENITMQMIARKSHFTQSNLYRYFKTKEEIFLRIYITDLRQFNELADAEFKTELELKVFAEKWTEILISQKRLLELAPLLTVSLEKNTSDEVYRQAKKAIAELSSALGAVVSRALPCLNNTQIYNFLITNQALAAGAWPLSRFTEAQKKIIKELDIEHVRIDFRPYYRNAVLTYLRGLCESD